MTNHHKHKEEKEMQDYQETDQPQETPYINTDENISGTSHLNDEIIEEESVREKLEKELQETKDKYLRLVAEFDNYKKRISRERLELIQTANKEVIISLLDVLDDCDRAARQMETNNDIETLKEGITLVFNKLKNTLYAQGLREMESLHAEFDTDLHDAITEVPAPSEDLKGKVLDNVQKGYYLNDKIIRHAKVVVGK